MASLDITNLYASIPVTETRTILTTMLENNHVETQEKSEILMWYDIITKQNYFAHNNIVTQRDGLAMGAPSSGLIAEMFLQQLEHRHLAHLHTNTTSHSTAAMSTTFSYYSTPPTPTSMTS
jgi:hypothetical protein